MAIDAHRSLEIPYVDPFTARSKRHAQELKDDHDREKERVVFQRFVESVRKTQPFFRKATEKELEGIFARLTPSEKRLYSEAASSPGANQKAPKIMKGAEAKKGKKESKSVSDMKGFISDDIEEEEYFSDGSEDVSLVSESDGGFESEKEDIVPKKKKSKKEKHHKKAHEASLSSVPSTTAGIKKFTWT